ncbi:5-formyltetrahydrofolate cyclo-ligase [Crocinitomicaceae bacterium]|nr:5-formyltetrahydrofolate cyclo-ligase [Crocinitomicaceae bacterium]
MTKEELRQKYLDLRKTLSPGELQRISDAVTLNLFQNFQFEKKKVSLFLPIERTKELNTYKIWEKATSFDAQVAVPKVNRKTEEMKHLLFESEDQLEISSWGIPEPSKGRVIAAEHFDIILVPLLTLDKRGHRVGYGKGYYDRFLSKCSPRCRFIGLSHFDDLEKTISDTTSSDIKLHGCVTPNKVYRFE